MSDFAVRIVTETLSALIAVTPAAVELVTGQSRADLEKRIARARAALDDHPIDTSVADAARRAELERIIAGGDPVAPLSEPQDS